MSDPLSKFGSFIVKNLRDQALDDLEMLLRGAWKSPATQDMQRRLGSLTDEQRQLFREVADRIITTGMHDFLFALQEASDANQGFEVQVDGSNIASLSDGLHGEIFSEEGWIAKHSKFPRSHD
ncbi:MAG: hypothetical protein U1F71_17185 [Verrucomicrobiaceae bacterium]